LTSRGKNKNSTCKVLKGADKKHSHLHPDCRQSSCETVSPADKSTSRLGNSSSSPEEKKVPPVLHQRGPFSYTQADFFQHVHSSRLPIGCYPGSGKDQAGNHIAAH